VSTKGKRIFKSAMRFLNIYTHVIDMAVAPKNKKCVKQFRIWFAAIIISIRFE
jgi:hypothetical protein